MAVREAGFFGVAAPLKEMILQVHLQKEEEVVRARPEEEHFRQESAPAEVTAVKSLVCPWEDQCGCHV